MKLFYLALFSVSLGVAHRSSPIRAFPSSNEITVRADITGAPITALKFNYGTTAAMGLPDWAQGDWVTWNTPGTNEYELHSSTYYVPTPGTPYYFQISAVWAWWHCQQHLHEWTNREGLDLSIRWRRPHTDDFC